MASRDRERSPRRDRRSGGGGNPRSDSKRAPPERRIFVSNIPYEMKWQEVKDMFRDEVGDVTYVQLFSDEDDKPRGCGILEFASEDLVRKAIEKMHRKELSGGRKLVVKEDFDIERDRYGRIIKGSGSGRDGRERGSGGGGGGRDRGDRDRGRRDDRNSRGGGGSVMGGGVGGGMGGYGNTYGLSPEFLSSLGIDSPLHTRLFVANLVYSVDEKKLREVFRLAGRVISVELNKDKDGKSRGHGVIEYSHPVEAVQAISMFHDQALYDRKMIVRFDKTPGPTPEELDELPSRLPEGLSDVGMGLGAGGNPLTNVAANLPSVQQNANNSAPAAANNVNNVASIADLASNLQGVAALARQLNMNIGGGDIKYGLGAGAGMGAASAAMGMMGGAAGGAGGGMGGPMGAAGGGAGLLGAMGGGAGGAASAAVGAMGNGVSMGGGIGGSGIGLGGAPAGGMGGGGGMSAGGGGGYGSGGAGGYSSGAGAGGMGGMGRGGAQSAAMAASGGAGAGGAGGGGVRSSDTILVRNLPMECSWQSLREGFSHCGDIKYAEMKERGVGLIRFTSERDAERAITMMDKQNVNGRTIDVRLY